MIGEGPGRGQGHATKGKGHFVIEGAVFRSWAEVQPKQEDAVLKQGLRQDLLQMRMPFLSD